MENTRKPTFSSTAASLSFPGIDGASDEPLWKRNAPCTLSTDGPGIYSMRASMYSLERNGTHRIGTGVHSFWERTHSPRPRIYGRWFSNHRLQSSTHSLGLRICGMWL